MIRLDAMIFISECWVLSQLFHSPLSPLSRGSLVPLNFLPLEWYHLHIWGYWYFSQKFWFQLESPRLAFHMIYFACKLNKQSDNIQPLCTSFFFFFFKFYFILKLYNIVLVLPNIKMNPPQVYPCSPSWTLSLLPPHTLPLGHPSAPAPSIRYRASNLDWRLVSYMILYMFQCHSPKSPHPLPLPLPQSP